MRMSPGSSSGSSRAAVLSTAPAGTISHTARGLSSLSTSFSRESTPVAPCFSSVFTAAALVSNTTQAWPRCIRRCAMLEPMRPRPIMPSCILSPRRRVDAPCSPCKPGICVRQRTENRGTAHQNRDQMQHDTNISQRGAGQHRAHHRARPAQRLHALGQSLWLDSISRKLVRGGGLQRYIDEFAVTGLTSNPTIFDKAIKDSQDYDASIREHGAAGREREDLLFQVILEDLTRAAELFRPVHDASQGVDGWVSLELSPRLADDTTGSVDAALKLHARADRPNLF